MSTQTRIDAHTHFFSEDPGFFEALNLKAINICFAQQAKDAWRYQTEIFIRMAQKWPNRFAWCTTFAPPGFDDPHDTQRTIETLEQDFNAGAIGCKVWKNIGMTIRKPDNSMLLLDDPILTPAQKTPQTTGSGRAFCQSRIQCAGDCAMS